jgi:uncharacterized membrane protein
MTWIILALLTPVCFSVTNFIDKYLIEYSKLTAVQLTTIVSLGMGLTGVIFGIAIGVHQLSAPDCILMTLAGMTIAVYVWPYFKALGLDETSRIIPLFQFSPLILIALAWIALGETLNIHQGWGAFMIILGGFGLSIERSVLGVFKLRPAFWLMMLSCFLYALSGLFIRLVVSQGDFGAALLFQGLGTILGSLLVWRFGRANLTFSNFKKPVIVGLLLTDLIISYLAIFSEVWAMSLVAANRVRTIQGIQPLFVVIFGTLLTIALPKIYKESLEPKSLALKGAVGVLMVVGVGLLYY